MNVENIDIFQGENVTQTLHARDRNNGVFNLTGCTITWNLGRPPNDPTRNFSSQVYTGTIVSAPLGTYTVAILPADTDNLTPGNYAHQTQVVDASGNTTIVNQGRLRLRSLLSQTSSAA